jgi:signal transduction histidine kinase
VLVARTPRAVVIEVSDNGRGFETAAPRKRHSLGLMGLRERAQLLKGTASIESEPGKGTRVQVRIPMNESGVAS